MGLGTTWHRVGKKTKLLFSLVFFSKTLAKRLLKVVFGGIIDKSSKTIRNEVIPCNSHTINFGNCSSTKR